jgi:hypothetical protein
MKRLQQAMHTAIRNISCYRLVGRPLSPTDVEDIYKIPLEKGLFGNEEWISVDYSAATDNLSWKYSGRIFEYVIQDIPEHDKVVARTVLGPHDLYYPKGSLQGEQKPIGYDSLPAGRMKRGQLMGSILSFVILCLSNFGLYLDVTQDYHIGWKLWEREASNLTNGDDQLYLAPLETFNRHIDIGNQVGLDMTVGKAYHHKEYTNVNSTCVTCPVGGRPYLIPFLNTGLFYGQHKVMERVGGDETETTRPNIVSVLNQVLDGALPGRSSSLLAHWFNSHPQSEIERDTLVLLPNRKSHKRNLFLPISMGGMGVNAPCDWRFKVTNMDRRFASALLPENLTDFDTNYPLRSTVKSILTYEKKPCENEAVTREDWYLSIELPNRPHRSFTVKRVRVPAICSGLIKLA